MASALDDASTDVDRVVRRFCLDVADRFAKVLREQGVTSIPHVQLGIAREAESSAVRTPRRQAELISKNWSWVCWSAHMSDRARHVEVRVNGKRTMTPRKSLGVHFAVFARIWSEEMRRRRLLNFRSRDGWSAKNNDEDWHHLELHAARIGRSHPRAQACLAEYVRMTLIENRPRNAKFENDHRALLAPHIERLLRPQGPGVSVRRPDQTPVESGASAQAPDPGPVIPPLR